MRLMFQVDLQHTPAPRPHHALQRLEEGVDLGGRGRIRHVRRGCCGVAVRCTAAQPLHCADAHGVVKGPGPEGQAFGQVPAQGEAAACGRVLGAGDGEHALGEVQVERSHAAGKEGGGGESGSGPEVRDQVEGLAAGEVDGVVSELALDLHLEEGRGIGRT